MTPTERSDALRAARDATTVVARYKSQFGGVCHWCTCAFPAGTDVAALGDGAVIHLGCVET